MDKYIHQQTILKAVQVVPDPNSKVCMMEGLENVPGNLEFREDGVIFEMADEEVFIKIGDWLIFGIGENNFYTCPDKIFKKSYKLLNEENS